MSDDNIQYLKLINGESIISYCSELLEGGVYVLHHPFKFNQISNPIVGTIVGSQLVPWIECANDGPIALIATNVMTKLDPSDQEKLEYRKMVMRIKLDEKAKLPEPANDNKQPSLTLVADNPDIVSSPSTAPLLLVYEEDEDELEDDYDLEDEEDEEE